MNRRVVLDSATTCVLLIAAGVLLWRVMSPARTTRSVEIPIPGAPVSLLGANLKGAPEARVVILEFSDFECPFCGVFSREVLPQIRSTYVDTGKVSFAFRHLPLSFHAGARPAAAAATCAGRQKRFWDLHDAVFADQGMLNEPNFIGRVSSSLGLDPAAMNACVSDANVLASVQADIDAANALRITGTPTFLIGLAEPEGVRVKHALTGARPYADFSRAIDALLGAQSNLLHRR